MFGKSGWGLITLYQEAVSWPQSALEAMLQQKAKAGFSRLAQWRGRAGVAPDDGKPIVHGPVKAWHTRQQREYLQ